MSFLDVKVTVLSHNFCTIKVSLFKLGTISRLILQIVIVGLLEDSPKLLAVFSAGNRKTGMSYVSNKYELVLFTKKNLEDTVS